MPRNDKPLDRSASSTVTWDIPKIVSHAMSGKLRVPTFQRSFVWDANDVIRLFDSLYRGFPIGTLLLWQQPMAPSISRFGPVRVDAGEEPEGLWIVDGQQRITTLVASLTSAPHEYDERFDVYFDFDRKRFVGPLRGVRPMRSIPVREVLESRRLITWLREHGDDLDEEDLETADSLGGALRDYRMPAYIVDEDDESLLREVFDRVNSAGKPISRAQVFHALFAGTADQGSPSSVISSIKNAGLGELDEMKVVQSLLSIRGGNIQRDIHDEFDDGEDIDDWYDRTERALEKTLRFLARQGASHSILFPSTFPIPVLAAFFDRHSDPDEWIMEILSRWLWRGWVHGFGRESGQTPALRKSVKLVNPIKGKPEASPDAFTAAKSLLETVESKDLQWFDLDKAFRTGRGSTRLVLLALASLAPLDPEGKEIDVAKMLDEHGYSAVGQLVPGIRSTGANRGFWLTGWPKLTGKEADFILESHAITPRAAQLLREGDIEGFLSVRRDHLIKLTTNFLNSKMDTDIPVRPTISSLIIPDPDEDYFNE